MQNFYSNVKNQTEIENKDEIRSKLSATINNTNNAPLKDLTVALDSNNL